MEINGSNKTESTCMPYSNKQIFILSGQSNMAGAGGVHVVHGNTLVWDGIIPPECKPNPKILRLNAKLHWEEAHEPLHIDIDIFNTSGIGPGLPFANSLRAQDPTTGVVGLVPCAVGGTPIKEWERGSYLYENMVNRARESIREGGVIKALLWYQGESDTNSLQDAESYKANMEQLIRNVRSDLQYPSLPIIQVALASAEGPYIEQVREAQLGMKVPNVVCVDAKGLPVHKDDHRHLTTEAEVKVGKMLADAYLDHFTSSTNPL